MSERAVLFDLDQTLIDSRAADPFRRAGQWSVVYDLVPELKPYAGISELLARLRLAGAKIGIVTSSPESYCTRVINYQKWQIDAVVCYHDTKRHKPHPEPIQLAVARLGVKPQRTLAVGDHPKDILAAQSAGIHAVAALWGSEDSGALLAMKPDAVCATVASLKQLLKL